MTEGPYGAVTAARRRHPKVLLIAGGIGITPLRALFESLPAAPGDLTLIYRAQREDEVVFRTELAELAARRGARLHIIVGRRRDLGWDPLSRTALESNVADLRQHDVFVCGPNGLTSTLVRTLRSARVPRRQIHHESFEF